MNLIESYLYPNCKKYDFNLQSKNLLKARAKKYLLCQDNNNDFVSKNSNNSKKHTNKIERKIIEIVYKIYVLNVKSEDIYKRTINHL